MIEHESEKTKKVMKEEMQSKLRHAYHAEEVMKGLNPLRHPSIILESEADSIEEVFTVPLLKATRKCIFSLLEDIKELS